MAGVNPRLSEPTTLGPDSANRRRCGVGDSRLSNFTEHSVDDAAMLPTPLAAALALARTGKPKTGLRRASPSRSLHKCSINENVIGRERDRSVLLHDAQEPRTFVAAEGWAQECLVRGHELRSALQLDRESWWRKRNLATA